jgi:hypothetical protein
MGGSYRFGRRAAGVILLFPARAAPETAREDALLASRG